MTPDAASWVPTAPDLHVIPAGRHWDAIQVHAFDGAVVQCGYRAPVIHDREHMTVTWLVPLGAATGWQLPSVARLLVAGQPVRVPPAPWTLPPESPPVVYWTSAPGNGIVHNVDGLRDVLARMARLFPTVGWDEP